MNELKRAPDNIGKLQTIFSDKRGRVAGVNKDRLNELPFMLNTNPPNLRAMMPTPLQGSPTRELRISAEGPMQVTQLNAKRTDIITPGSGLLTVVAAFPQVNVVGTGTKFQEELEPGDTILVVDDAAILRTVNVDIITSARNLAVTAGTAFPGAVTALPYNIWKRFDMCLLQLYSRDGQSVVPLSNNYVHRDTITGSLGQPYRLPEALYTDETRAMAVVARDISALGGTALLGNGLQLTLPSAKYTKEQLDPNLKRIGDRLKAKQFLAMPYFYTADVGAIALTRLGYSESIITIPESSHFELHQMSVAFGPTEANQFLIDIVDLAKGESIINAPSGRDYMLPWQLIFGQNGYPYRLPEPIMIYAGQKLLVKMQETAGNAASTVYITLGGKMVPVRNWST